MRSLERIAVCIVGVPQGPKATPSRGVRIAQRAEAVQSVDAKVVLQVGRAFPAQVRYDPRARLRA